MENWAESVVTKLLPRSCPALPPQPRILLLHFAPNNSVQRVDFLTLVIVALALLVSIGSGSIAAWESRAWVCPHDFSLGNLRGFSWSFLSLNSIIQTIVKRWQRLYSNAIQSQYSSHVAAILRRSSSGPARPWPSGLSYPRI